MSSSRLLATRIAPAGTSGSVQELNDVAHHTTVTKTVTYPDNNYNYTVTVTSPLLGGTPIVTVTRTIRQVTHTQLSMGEQASCGLLPIATSPPGGCHLVGGTAGNWINKGMVWGGAVAATIVAAAQDGEDPASDDAAYEGLSEALCGGESFTAGTRVLLASGAAVAIDSLKPGEKVLATNTKTGKTQAEPVTAVLVHHDTNRYDLRVKTARGTAVIDTTSRHLFWDPANRQWVEAAALGSGAELRTPGGATAEVLGGYQPRDRAGWMWDLSVPGNNDHDFYVDTAATAVLVHNCPSINENNAEHIFRDAPGHLADDTSENRELIESVVQPGNYVRTGGGGEDLFRETLPNGTQVWAKVFDGSITNGGVNQVPLP